MDIEILSECDGITRQAVSDVITDHYTGNIVAGFVRLGAECGGMCSRSALQ